MNLKIFFFPIRLFNRLAQAMSYSSLIFPLWKNTAADVCQYLNTKDASKKIHLANSLATQQ